MPDENTKKIASLNDSFRRTLTGGLVVLTPGVESLPYKDRIIEAVRTYQFQGIDDDNPYGENDFGTVTIEGEKYFFKIDYYDRNLEAHSPDAADPKVTRRVLTVMKADEY